MGLRKIARAFRRAKGRATRARNLISYRLGGRKPWTRGYFEHKWGRIQEAVSNAVVMPAFQRGGLLPKGFGAGIDERIIEYPWLLSHLPSGPARLLDAGSALNFEAILAHPALAGKKITIVNLNPESNCFWRRGISYLFEDIRSLPFLPDSFDIITCVSTLEHVGMDNTQKYTGDPTYRESKREDYVLALKELGRVLRKGGILFLTVPFGRYGDFGFFQQFDPAMLKKMTGAFNASRSETAFYKYENGGWGISDEAGCVNAEYVTADRARKGGSLPAAAEAVACLMLIK